jgi:molecular chaperone GrpE (heat shock protein)
MTEHVPARLPKWPFFVGDFVLIALAGLIVYLNRAPFGPGEMAFCLAAVALGSWIAVLPFLKEFRVSAQMAEANIMASAVAQIKNLEQIKNQISQATSQWMLVQDQSTRTVQSAQDLTDRINAEAKEICSFFEKMNEAEKAHLRLEAEKLRRSEGEWLQVTVRILDHIFALNRAASRSGQPALISQMNQFQNASREAARRVGLVPLLGRRDEQFDPRAHQLLDPQTVPPATAQIAETLAPGYTFQTQLIRKALVSLRPDHQPELPLMPAHDEEKHSLVAEAPITDSAPIVESRENAATAV